MISRGLAMALGIAQSIVLVRILSVSEWGLKDIALSVGGALGIYQHLGLSSGSVREISSAKNDAEVFKIFITSVIIRYIITFPLGVGLFIFSNRIAIGVYNNPDLVLPLKLYALVILIQGLQGLMNAVISGLKRFKHLFIYQVVISVVSLLIFIPLVYMYRVPGFFYALVIFNVISTVSLAVLAFAPLRASLVLPSKADFVRLFKEIFSISMAIYLVKIIYTNWDKFGGYTLGAVTTPEMVGYFTFAMLFAKKIVSVSDAVTDVNLPVMSETYSQNVAEFKDLFKKNFDKLFLFVIISSSVAVYWSPELIDLAAGAGKYTASFPLILPLVAASVAYSLMNIIKSSIYIPAKLIKEMILSFVVLLGASVVSFVILKFSVGLLTAMAYALLVGSILALLLMSYYSQKKVALSIFDKRHLYYAVQALAVCCMSIIGALWFKILVFAIALPLLVLGAFLCNFISYSDIIKIKNLFTTKFRKA